MRSSTPKVAVFASGSGSNFEAMLEKDDLTRHIGALICDKPGAPVIQRAQEYHIPVCLLSPGDFGSKAAYEREVLSYLQEKDITWIVLAGYMRLIGPTLLEAFRGKIVNIHPSLLPAFPGLDATGQALRADVSETGVTVHYVDPGMDTGPIITQQKVPILPNDTKETLQMRLQKVEHTLYPDTIETLIKQ